MRNHSHILHTVSYHIRSILTRYRKVIPIVIAFAAVMVYVVPIDSIIAQNGRGPPSEVPPERGQSQSGEQGQGQGQSG